MIKISLILTYEDKLNTTMSILLKSLNYFNYQNILYPNIYEGN